MAGQNGCTVTTKNGDVYTFATEDEAIQFDQCLQTSSADTCAARIKPISIKRNRSHDFGR